MELNDYNVLYMSECFLDSYTPFTHNELQILYRFLKKFQIERKLTVSLSCHELSDMLCVSEETFLYNLYRFIATAPTKTIYVGSDNDRRLVRLIRYGIVDQPNDVVTVVLTEDAEDFFLCADDVSVVRLDIISGFEMIRDSFCDDIKLYQYLANQLYKSGVSSGSLFVAVTLDTLFFISSTFEWAGEKYDQDYINLQDIQDMAKDVTERLNYRSKRYMWHVFCNSFIRKDIEIINKCSDIFIEGHKVIKNGLNTVGCVFKIKWNKGKDTFNRLPCERETDIELQKKLKKIYSQK